jgi:hypothetical protein
MAGTLGGADRRILIRKLAKLPFLHVDENVGLKPIADIGLSAAYRCHECGRTQVRYGKRSPTGGIGRTQTRSQKT